MWQNVVPHSCNLRMTAFQNQGFDCAMQQSIFTSTMNTAGADIGAAEFYEQGHERVAKAFDQMAAVSRCGSGAFSPE